LIGAGRAIVGILLIVTEKQRPEQARELYLKGRYNYG